MLHSGVVIDFKGAHKGLKIDKHSTGGVGDKTSLIIAPIAASCGVFIPMISGRGLGHTGGTLDKLESIPGFNSQLPQDEFIRIVAEYGVCFIGQTPEICPADKKMYALRDVTATVECIPLICASIMSKKLAEGIDGLVLDVKFGSGAFMKSVKDAENLARKLMAIAKASGKRVSALLTDMNKPLGKAIGNALEVQECIDVMNNKGPEDLRELSLQLAAHMIFLAKKS
jgi:pyrimidine-nucleoside phosphorylase